MKKFLFILLASVILFSCEEEYEPSGYIPEIDASINMIFADSILGMKANVKLEFSEENCRSISASYGDNVVIYYQLIQILNDFDAVNCIEDKIIPKFDNLKIKKKFGFYAFSSNDSIEMATWYDENYIFFMKTNKDYLHEAVDNFKFLKFR